MAEYECYLNIENIGTRNELRMRVVNELSNEIPGSGNGTRASRYKYYVESLIDGNRIYLRRPANLHNGFDFVVCVENINFNPKGRKRNYPKHEDIINDLIFKFKENPHTYLKLYSILESTYLCKKAIISINNNEFKSGFPCELIIKVLKWLFIEQDIRYWNYSGRDMLWESISKIHR